MSVLTTAWNTLTYNLGGAGLDAFSRLTVFRGQRPGNIEYRPNYSYRNVFVFVAKRMAVRAAVQAIHDIVPNIQRQAEKKKLDAVHKWQNETLSHIIKQRNVQKKDFGRLVLHGKDGRNVGTIVAHDKYGEPVHEALFVWYDDDKSNEYVVNDAWQIDDKKEIEEDKVVLTESVKSYSTITHFHLDLTPYVTMSSNKNIVMTQVQGRDNTRKELVSGGDLSFNVSGSIVSDVSGVYPDVAVKQFMNVMQYGGIVNVKHFFLENLNVTRGIIRDFSLGKQVYKNVQPYSFSFVAIEPDEAISVAVDTISVMNAKFKESDVDGIYKFVLNRKMQKIVKGVSGIVESAGTDAVVSGLNDIMDFNDV